MDIIGIVLDEQTIVRMFRYGGFACLGLSGLLAAWSVVNLIGRRRSDTRKGKRPPFMKLWLFPVFFAFIGLIFVLGEHTVRHGFLVCTGFVGLALSGLMGAQSVVRLIRWRRSEGEVVGFSQEEGCYFPVIEFDLPDGTEVRFTASSGRGTRRFTEGDRVPIFYDPRDPQKADLRTFMGIWFFPIVLLFFGLIFAIGSGMKLLEGQPGG